MHRTTTVSRALAALFALLLLAACGGGGGGGGGDDDGAAGTDTEGAAAEAEPADGEPLDEDEARAEGNPETFERIAAEEDCAALEKEKAAHEANAERREARRASILEAYADAAGERMEELGC